MNVFGENITHCFIKRPIPVSYRALFDAALHGTAEEILRRRLPPPSALYPFLLLICQFFSHLSWQIHSSDRSWKKELQLLLRKLWDLGAGAVLRFGAGSKKPHVCHQGGSSLCILRSWEGDRIPFEALFCCIW